MWHDPDHEPDYSQTVELDLSTVERSIAGPKRPQDRIPPAAARQAFRCLLAGEDQSVAVPGGLDASAGSFPASDPISISRRPPPGRAAVDPVCEAGQSPQDLGLTGEETEPYGLEVPSRKDSAAWISAAWVSVCGKLPRWVPVAGSISSA